MKQVYKFAVIATDVIIFSVHNQKLQVLLIKMKKKPFLGKWAAPGGLVNSEESVDSASVRVLAEKTGIKNAYLEQLYTFGKVNRDPFGRVVSVAYAALIPYDHKSIQTTSEYADIQWFPVSKLPPLAYDHEEIVKVATQRLRDKLGYTNIAFSLLPNEFTLGELQSLYEIILNKKLDKRNFRKKLLALKLIKKLSKIRTGDAHRPAELFTFKTRSLVQAQIL